MADDTAQTGLTPTHGVVMVIVGSAVALLILGYVFR